MIGANQSWANKNTYCLTTDPYSPVLIVNRVLKVHFQQKKESNTGGTRGFNEETVYKGLDRVKGLSKGWWGTQKPALAESYYYLEFVPKGKEKK